MSLEGKSNHPPQLRFLLRPHDPGTDLLKGDMVGVRPGLGIGRQSSRGGQIFLSRKTQQGKTVVKDGGWAGQLSRMVIPQEAKVPKMPILVVYEGVEHQHTAQLFPILRIQTVIIVETRLERPRLHKAGRRHIGRIHIGEQMAFGGSNALPVFQIIPDSWQPHTPCNLGGVILAEGLSPGYVIIDDNNLQEGFTKPAG